MDFISCSCVKSLWPLGMFLLPTANFSRLEHPARVARTVMKTWCSRLMSDTGDDEDTLESLSLDTQDPQGGTLVSPEAGGHLLTSQCPVCLRLRAGTIIRSHRSRHGAHQHPGAGGRLTWGGQHWTCGDTDDNDDDTDNDDDDCAPVSLTESMRPLVRLVRLPGLVTRQWRRPGPASHTQHHTSTPSWVGTRHCRSSGVY